jgi:iron-sulfur cluster repair protein YtfE (RIC family)
LSAAVRTPGVDSARARRLASHWDFVEDQLHQHHRVEDESLWPLVRPKLAGRAAALAVLDDMEAQHRSLSPENRAIDEGFASYRAGPGEAAGTELAGHLDAMRILLEAHLDDEESRCFPVIDEALSAEEFESFGKATAKAVGLRGSAHFFPWIFDGAAAVDRRAVLTMPPPPVRVLCRRVWEPRYERHVADLWTA